MNSLHTCAHACSSMSPLLPWPDRSRSRYCAVVRLSRMLMLSSSFLYWLMSSGAGATVAGKGTFHGARMGQRRGTNGGADGTHL